MKKIMTKKQMAERLEVNVNSMGIGKGRQSFFEILKSLMKPKEGNKWTTRITNALYGFYQTPFKEKLSMSEESILSFLDWSVSP